MAAEILSYEAKRRPNPFARPALIAGVILFFASLIPLCGLTVIPLAWAGLIVGLVGIAYAIWGRRRGLAPSIFGSLLCLAAAFIPAAMLGTVPFLARLGLKIWSSNNQPPAPLPPPATAPSTPATRPADELEKTDPKPLDTTINDATLAPPAVD